MTQRPRNPDSAGSSVPFPPPLAYIAGMAMGFALQRFVPGHLATAAQSVQVVRLVGGTVLALSLLLVLFSMVSFRRARTSPGFSRASTSLIVHGPFQLSRNPVYLAGALFHCGLSLLANALWPLLLLIPAVMVVNAMVKREEQYLARRFGTEYEAYRRGVRRWL